MTGPDARCYRCGARHAEHRLQAGSYVCVGVPGTFADDPGKVVRQHRRPRWREQFTTSIKLQRCPFCERGATIVGSSGRFWALCDSTLCFTSGPFRGSPKHAAQAWNYRPGCAPVQPDSEPADAPQGVISGPAKEELKTPDGSVAER